MEGAGELGASGATCTITLTSAESWNPLTEPVSPKISDSEPRGRKKSS